MLGQQINDPAGHESRDSGLVEAWGLGLLSVVTEFSADKSTVQVRGVVAADRGLLSGAAGLPVRGYEIHMGQTSVAAGDHAIEINERSRRPVHGFDGALDEDGLTLGTYMHGLFHNDELRRAMLRFLATRRGVELDSDRFAGSLDAEFDRLADFVTEHLDMSLIYREVGLPFKGPHKSPLPAGEV